MTEGRDPTRGDARPASPEPELLREFFAEVHAEDRAPSFEQLVNRPGAAASAHRPPAAPTALRQPAFAVLAVLLAATAVVWLVPGLRDGGPGSRAGSHGPNSLSDTEQYALAEQLSRVEAPLDFLLDTPGRELLYAPPSFELMRLPRALPGNAAAADRTED